MNLQIILIFLFVSVSCCHTADNTVDYTKYLEYKTTFDSSLTQHFPPHPVVEKYDVTLHTEPGKNNVWLILLYSDLNDIIYKSISKDLLSQETKAVYDVTDSCVLFINPFETSISLDESIMPEIDTSKIDMLCYKGKLPIPNLFNTEKSMFFKERAIENNFKVFVIDAEPNFKTSSYPMEPNVQMPTDWKNGYSRGFALDSLNHSVVYWLSIW